MKEIKKTLATIVIFSILVGTLTGGIFYNPHSPKSVDSLLYSGTRSWSNGEFTNYNVSDGLVSNSITSLMFDSKTNLLYIGTLSGLSIFDTVNNTFFNRNITNGLLSDDIVALALDQKRNLLYIGTCEDGLCVYDIKNDTFSNKTSLNNDWGNKHIRELEFDTTNNVLYIGTIRGNITTYYIENDTFKSKFLGKELHFPDGYAISCLMLIPNTSKVYVGTVDGVESSGIFGIYYSNNDTFMALRSSTGNALVLDVNRNRTYKVGNGCGLIIANATTGEYITQKWDKFPPFSGSSVVHDFVRDILFIGTYHEGLKLYNISMDTFTNKNMSNGLPSDWVTSLAIDIKKQELYIGTDNGLSIYNITYVPQPPKIYHTPVTSARINTSIFINATVTDDISVNIVELYYKNVGNSKFASENMALINGTLQNGTWMGLIPPQSEEGIVYYYIRATDVDDYEVTSPANISSPYEITVTENNDIHSDWYGFISTLNKNIFSVFALILFLLVVVISIFLIKNKKKKNLTCQGKRGVMRLERKIL